MSERCGAICPTDTTKTCLESKTDLYHAYHKAWKDESEVEELLWKNAAAPVLEMGGKKNKKTDPTLAEIERKAVEERRAAAALAGLDLPASQRAADEGIAASYGAVDPVWKEAAKEVIRRLAHTQQVLVSDDLWASGLEKPREPRAAGGIWQWAAKVGLIEKTNEYRPTAQVESHANPTVVWRSLVFEPEPPHPQPLVHVLRDFG